MSGRDYQRARLYGWEDELVASLGQSLIPFAQAQGMVDAIWCEMGLRYPPKIEPLPRQARGRHADATKLVLRLPEQVPSWILLHEMAHAMSSTHEGASDGRVPTFVGLYFTLLVRYLRLDRATLLQSLATTGIADPAARPLFSDHAAWD